MRGCCFWPRRDVGEAKGRSKPGKNKNGLRNGLYGPFFISGLAFEDRSARTHSISMAEVTSDLYRTVERTVGGLGYRLVDVERLGAGLLRVSLESENGVGLEDCERVSHQLSHLFAVEQVDYQRLEVSSPGLDRRLRGADDFARFAGKEINVQLCAPSDAAGGRKRLRGRVLQLVGVQGEERLQLHLMADEAPAKKGHRSAG